MFLIPALHDIPIETRAQRINKPALPKSSRKKERDQVDLQRSSQRRMEYLRGFNNKISFSKSPLL